MKFCPQCGTTFEPGARFCLECGFDKSSVEPEPAPVETPPSEPAKAQGCPQCGGALDPADRFCQECGFDTINIKYSRPEVAQPLPLPVEENIISPPPTPVEPVFSTAANQFCQQCGTIMAAGERFCSGCGFDTKADPAKPVPMEQPAVMPRPEPRAIPPVNPPTAPQPARTQASSYAQVSQPPPIQKKSRKSWLSIVLIVAGLAILGAGGWYGYNRFIAKPVTETALPEPITPAEQPVSQPAAPDVNSEQATEPEAAPAKQASSDKKPLSRVDQELAKYRAKEQPQATPQNKPNLAVTASSAPAVNNQLTTTILEIGKKDEPKNKNPKNPIKLMLRNPTMIVRITTDHYNNGMGTARGGNISIKDKEGNVIGTFRANGISGKNGTPNAKWVAEPHKVLEKGTYYIWDSDMPTWSKNFVGNGFVVVEGYEVE